MLHNFWTREYLAHSNTNIGSCVTSSAKCIFGKFYMKVCYLEAVDYAKMESSKSFPILEDISEENTAVSEPHIPEYTPSAASLVPEFCHSTVSMELACGVW